MLKFTAQTPREEVFVTVRRFLENKGLVIVDHDDRRPWGGYFVIREAQAFAFIRVFFTNVDPDDFKVYSNLSPKILLVAPGKRLSWQYHNRRSEIWKVIEGKVAVAVSETDEQSETKQLAPGDIMEIKQGQRHRLIGLDEWVVIAEVWKHSDTEHPSDEEDIVRVEDDFGR